MIWENKRIIVCITNLGYVAKHCGILNQLLGYPWMSLWRLKMEHILISVLDFKLATTMFVTFDPYYLQLCLTCRMHIIPDIIYFWKRCWRQTSCQGSLATKAWSENSRSPCSRYCYSLNSPERNPSHQACHLAYLGTQWTGCFHLSPTFCEWILTQTLFFMDVLSFCEWIIILWILILHKHCSLIPLDVLLVRQSSLSHFLV